MSIAGAMKKPFLRTFGIFSSDANLTLGDVENWNLRQIDHYRDILNKMVEYLDKKYTEKAEDKIRMLEIELELANRKIAAQEESE